MRTILGLWLLPVLGLYGQIHPLQHLIDAARQDSPELKGLLGQGAASIARARWSRGVGPGISVRRREREGRIRID
jgi:hypothetical protein